MRESDERARGRRAKAIEAYDAFVRNNPEATRKELFGRREMLSDGSNYLLAALPDDASIAKQIERNEAAAQVRKEAEEMTRLDQLQKRQGMISEALLKAIDSDLGDRFANPSKTGKSDQELLASVRKILPEALQKDFDKNYPAGFSLSDLRSTRELAKLQEAKAAIEMFGNLTPEQVRKAGLPTNIVPFAIAVAERNQLENARLKAEEGRKDKRLQIAQAQADLARSSQMFRESQTELTNKITMASEAEKQRLSRVKTARELTNQAQEQAASQLKLTGVSQASALAEDAGLSDDEKEIVTNNVQAIAEIFAVTETQIAEIAKIAVEQADLGSITSIKEAFEQKSGRLARRIDIVMQAGLGIETAPSVMTARIDDTGAIQSDPGSYIDGVQQNIQKVTNELADIVNAAPTTPDAQIQQAYRMQANRIQQLREALSLPGFNVTSGFDPAVVNQIKDTVNSLEARLIDMQANVKGTPATTATPAPAPATTTAMPQAQAASPVTVSSAPGSRTPTPTINKNAADAVIANALTMLGTQMGTGRASRNLVGLRQALARASGLNPVTDVVKLDALEAYARQQYQDIDTAD